MKTYVKLLSIYLIRKRLELLVITNSFVFSRLFICPSVWNNTFATNNHKLQNVQNFAASIILGLRKYDLKVKAKGSWVTADSPAQKNHRVFPH